MWASPILQFLLLIVVPALIYVGCRQEFPSCE
jgi:hypothetical protein